MQLDPAGLITVWQAFKTDRVIVLVGLHILLWNMQMSFTFRPGLNHLKHVFNGAYHLFSEVEHFIFTHCLLSVGS